MKKTTCMSICVLNINMSSKYCFSPVWVVVRRGGGEVRRMGVMVRVGSILTGANGIATVFQLWDDEDFSTLMNGVEYSDGKVYGR